MNTPHLLVSNIFFAPYTYGGATVVAEQVARALQDRHGWRISVLSAVSRRDLPDYAIRKVQTGSISNFVINMPATRPYAQMYSNPQVTEAAARLIRSLRPDLMHLHCIQELGIGLLQSARQEKVPVILSTHDFWWICERQFMIRPDGRYCGQNPVRNENCNGCSSDPDQSRTRFLQLRAAAGLADLITYPSAFARDLCRASGLQGAADAVWQNGVVLPRADFAGRQKARRAKDPRLVFGFCGGPSNIKGWHLVRGAFEGLKRDDFRVHLADASMDGGWWRGRDLSKLPGTWQVQPRYSQEEMDDFWSGIDVLLFPSQWKETFGLTIREALARGIRVIQTESGGTTEHAGPDLNRAFPIGAGAKVLRSEIEHALTRPDRYAEPTKVRDFDAQADHFKQLARPFLTRGAQNRPAALSDAAPIGDLRRA